MQKVNLELKYFCSDFNQIRKILKEIKARKVGTFNQKDYFFKLAEKEGNIPSRLKLRIENSKQTLIYYQRPNFSKNSATSAIIILFQVKDKKLLLFLKKSLGVKGIVTKSRKIWKKENVVFHLDKVKGVGKIFEIEVTVKNQKEDALKFNKYKKIFLPYLNKVVRGSNIDLVKEKAYKI